MYIRFIKCTGISTTYQAIETEVSDKKIILFFKNLSQYIINMEMHFFLAFFPDATAEERNNLKIN